MAVYHCDNKDVRDPAPLLPPLQTSHFSMPKKWEVAHLSRRLFALLPGKDSLPKPLEHRAVLSSVRVLVGAFDFFRQTVGNQRSQPILAAILNRLLVVPAFELQHVQRTVHVRDLRLHVGLPLLEHGLALGIR